MKGDINISPEQMNKVLGKIGEELATYRLFEGGFINPVYFLTTKKGKEIVLRITHPLPKWKHWKTQNEVTIMNFLRTHTNIPVPKVLVSADEPDLIGYEYILMEKMQGVQFNQYFPTAPVEEKYRLIRQLFAIVAELRRFPFQKIGNLRENMEVGREYDIEAGPFPSLKKYLSAALLDRAKDIRHHPKYAGYASRFRQMAKQMQEPEFTLPHFPFVLTQNFEDKNILVKEGEITAILDFEWSGSFPDFYDLRNIRDFLDFKANPEMAPFFKTQMAHYGWNLDLPEKVVDLEEMEHLAMCLGSYQAWFIGNEAEGEIFIQDCEKKAEALLTKYGM